MKHSIVVVHLKVNKIDSELFRWIIAFWQEQPCSQAAFSSLIHAMWTMESMMTSNSMIHEFQSWLRFFPTLPPSSNSIRRRFAHVIFLVSDSCFRPMAKRLTCRAFTRFSDVPYRLLQHAHWWHRLLGVDKVPSVQRGPLRYPWHPLEIPTELPSGPEFRNESAGRYTC